MTNPQKEDLYRWLLVLREFFLELTTFIGADHQWTASTNIGYI